MKTPVRRGAVKLMQHSFDTIREAVQEGVESGRLNAAIESRAWTIKFLYPSLDEAALITGMQFVAEAPLVERFGREDI